jgi:hypothetical protein
MRRILLVMSRALLLLIVAASPALAVVHDMGGGH